jgi:hypothetical protein
VGGEKIYLVSVEFVCGVCMWVLILKWNLWPRIDARMEKRWRGLGWTMEKLVEELRKNFLATGEPTLCRWEVNVTC